MKRIPSTAGRSLAGVLFTVMLVVGVIKAQGCQRPMDETPEAEPVIEAPAQTNAAEVPTAATAAQAEPAAVAAESADAGSDASVAPEIVEPRPMMPATKSGRVIWQQDPAPQQQKSE